MTTLYLAGPMRGIPEFNFPAFFQAEKKLVEAGYDVISPARRDVDNGFKYEGMTGNEDLTELGFDLKEALLWDLNAVADADGVALLSGYTSSKGAKAEITLAQALGKPVHVVGHWLGEKIFGDPTVDVYVDEPKEDDSAVLHHYLGDNLVGQFTKIRDPYEALRAHVNVDEHGTLHGGAVMVTSETGGQKGSKPEQLGTYDPLALQELAKVSGFGAQKYAAFNYLKGYDWSLSFNAMMRHALAFWNGEDLDDETGLPHMAHAMWHAVALVSFYRRQLGTDDRYKAA